MKSPPPTYGVWGAVVVGTVLCKVGTKRVCEATICLAKTNKQKTQKENVFQTKIYFGH